MKKKSTTTETAIDANTVLTPVFMSVLNEIAPKWAKKFGYKLEEDKEYDPDSDFHPLSRALNISQRQLKFKGVESGSYINTRQRFGNPRLDISSPGQEWFVGLEYKTDGTFSECQIFHPKGVEMMPIIKKEVDDMWRSLNGC